jgi:hypothetical protein
LKAPLAVEDLKEIGDQLVQLLIKQYEIAELAMVVELTDVEWQEYETREDRIHELKARLRQSKSAA